MAYSLNTDQFKVDSINTGGGWAIFNNESTNLAGGNNQGNYSATTLMDQSGSKVPQTLITTGSMLLKHFVKIFYCFINGTLKTNPNISTPITTQ